MSIIPTLGLKVYKQYLEVYNRYLLGSLGLSSCRGMPSGYLESFLDDFAVPKSSTGVGFRV